MLGFKILVKTTNNAEAVFEINSFKNGCCDEKNNIKVEKESVFPYKVKITPPVGDTLNSVKYLFSTELKNFHQVIVPDTGRTYPSQMQLVDFWSKNWLSRINNVRMPLFILTGTDMFTELAFGVLGQNYETQFYVEEPAQHRALVAWMKRLTLSIERGSQQYPIPCSEVCDAKDGSLTEYIYIKEEANFETKENWIESLRGFSGKLAEIIGCKPRTTDITCLPLWCSWTDWFSGDVDEQVIINNVKEGLKVGIKNYVIDDGWFGPGLDYDFDTTLNIGDWTEDGTRIKDLKALVKEIHDLGANAIIWCAPHAVAPDCKTFEKKKKYLVQNKPGELMMTPNKFHSLCFMSPEGREVMADICAKLITDYDVDGTKYDLFNCVPDEPCASTEHKHDTDSMIEGLRRTLELIHQKTSALKPDYMVELKQNYGTPYLYKYGTCVRAGDTPYNPEGNFLRTAYVNAYTPYSINDYQTITSYDSVSSAAAIIIKMMAVGIPTYSIDLETLSQENKNVLGFFNNWYIENIPNFKNYRVPLTPSLESWLAPGESKDIYFLLNYENTLEIKEIKDCEILNGSSCKKLYLALPEKTSVAIEIDDISGKGYFKETYQGVTELTLKSKAGDIIKIHPK